MPTRHPKRPPWTAESARLREAYEESDLTSYQDLAARAGVVPSTIGDMLKGRRVPNDASLRAVCDALEVTVAWVKHGGDHPKRLVPGQRNALRAGNPRSAAHHLGIERWLADQRTVSPDEREWMRTILWPAPHLRYPDLVYNVILHTYRQMREYRPNDADEAPASDRPPRS